MLTSSPSGAASDPGQLLSVTALPATGAGRVVVEVTGEVDAYTAPLLDVCLQSQTRRAPLREILVDLRRVSFLGAAGITALVRAQKRCRTRGARLLVASGGQNHLRRALRLSGLTDVLTLDPVAA